MQDQTPSKNALVIQEPELICVLIDAIWTLKFDTDPVDGYEFASSPLVAEVVNRACDCLIALYREQGLNASANDLIKRRKLHDERYKGSFELEALPSHIRLIQKHWDAWSEKQRMDHLRVFLTPTVVTDAELLTLLASLTENDPTV